MMRRLGLVTVITGELDEQSNTSGTAVTRRSRCAACARRNVRGISNEGNVRDGQRPLTRNVTVCVLRRRRNQRFIAVWLPLLAAWHSRRRCVAGVFERLP